jgi:chemotaxis protein MotB
MAGGLAENRVLRVQGLAFSQPFERNDPTAASNRRISIIVMNRDAEDRLSHQAATGRAEARAPTADGCAQARRRSR